MQQQNTKPIVSSNSGDYATEHLQTDYTCPVDVSIPPPSFTTSSTSYFVQHPPPATYLIAPPPIKIKEEIKEQAGLYTDLPTYLHTIYDLLLVTHNVFTISL